MNRQSAHWHLETDDRNIAWLRLDKTDGSANVLSEPVLTEFATFLDRLDGERPAALVVHSGKDNGFIMGADIKEFARIDDAGQAYDAIRLGQQVMDRLEALPFPSVAVINGFALGGGLELAMACTYRLAINLDKPVIGLPEVQLGLHPGFGGTVRSVELCGVRAAMELMLTGKSITVSRARRTGLIDRICEAAGWREAAVDLVLSGSGRNKAGLLDRLLNLAPIRPLLANVLRKQVARKARKEHYPAPYAIVDLWLAHGASRRGGFDAEARSMSALMVTRTSRNLVRVFFLQNKLKSQGDDPPSEIRHVHVVGAGVMGGDIGAWCALKGLEVTLQDRDDKYIRPALERARKLFDRKTYNDADRASAEKRLTGDVAGTGVHKADLVIEAIFEDREAKQALYRSLQADMKAGAVLATNTSSIRLEELREVLDEPMRFVGLHFFNPVAQLPLIELVRCSDTLPEVLNIGFAFIKRIGKLGLLCASSPGFVVNRLLAPYMSEAMQLANEGVALADIDRAAERFGMPMGPVELVDTVGIDVALNVSQVLGAAYDRPVPDTLSTMVEAKQLGRKSGHGFYRWENGKAVKPDGGGAVPDDIEDRLLLPMVNEAVACLSEGVVDDADLLDAGVIFGTGFAPFRGGPLQYARDRGVSNVRSTLQRLADAHGERYRPHPGWETFE